MEAIAEGYSEGIALDTDGLPQRRQRPEPVPRARQRHLHAAAVAPRSCRASRAIRSSRWRSDLGFTVREEMLPREMLYIADEAFFVGTAAEITPIRSVDKITDRQRPPRPGHRGDPAGVLRRHQRRDARPARLADVRLPGRAASGGERRDRSAARRRPHATCNV